MLVFSSFFAGPPGRVPALRLFIETFRRRRIGSRHPDALIAAQRAPAMDISELLAFSVKNKASDLHLSAGLPPMIRVHGDVRRINLPPLEHKDVHGMIYDIMNDAQR